ncbi:unnamed protein product [Caenorhabditis angaria]|uniref:G-protein coupled receptors family 1 profile domain-containing protein n=1 Tax=Caenorhabditis angaria TaxID=860376 RepID=A0A9P1IZ07_9PELO|nr:unnamed protein product [Caenorhabditis angaria]
MSTLSDAEICFLNVSTGMTDTEKRTTVGICILFFSLLSFLLNIIVIFAIFKSWKLFKGQPFTQFVISMIVAGTIYSSVNFFVSIPCTLTYCSYLESDPLMIIFATPNTLSFLAYLLANFGFSIYRLSIVFGSCFKNATTFIHLITLYLPWLVSFLATIDTTYRGCIKRFNRFSIGYTYNCSNCKVWFGISFIDVNFYAGQILPIIMCLMYFAMIVNVYFKRMSTGYMAKSVKSDLRMALQYLIVCLAQYLSSFLFYIVPKYGNGSLLAVIAMNTIGVIDVGINPLILLLFNGKMREATIVLFSFIPSIEAKRSKMTVTVVPTSYKRPVIHH